MTNMDTWNFPSLHIIPRITDTPIVLMDRNRAWDVGVDGKFHMAFKEGKFPLLLGWETGGTLDESLSFLKKILQKLMKSRICSHACPSRRRNPPKPGSSDIS